MKRYQPSDIEPKWAKIWADTGLYKTVEDPTRPKYYMLTEFPYPSGEGLHAGHIREYTIGDTMARYKRMQGHNVLFPFGFDEFGLPTENYAIKHKIPPQVATDRNVATFRAQLDQLGYMIDWDRQVHTSDPKYYKWTQWLFLQFLKAGLAYQDEIAINWCPFEKTGLANEEVVNGKHERCGTPVEKKLLKQWMFRITDYADRLIDGLKTVDYPSRIADQQINWIGRSEGAEIDFKLRGITGQSDDKHQVTVYTTRPDTIFGATFIVVAPEVAKSWMDIGWKAPHEVETYVKTSIAKAELERQESKDKTGVDTGIKAVHPLTGNEIPVWVADYVLAGYGTGAIMAVPAHDERDGEFAVKFGLPITTVVEPVTGTPQEDEEYRRSIVALVRNPKTNEVISIKWGAEGGGHNILIGGGIDENEDIVEAARREVIEETGYQNLKFIAQSERIHHHYVAHSKGGKKRNIDVWGVYFELENDEHVEPVLEEDEKGKFTVEWLSPDKVEKLIKDPLHEYVYNKFLARKFYTGYGPLVNSGEFDGLEGEAAKSAIIEKLKESGSGKGAKKYKLRDWIFSRQHYWGEPIPVIHCPHCKAKIEQDALELSFHDQATWDRLVKGEKTIETRANDPKRRFADKVAGDYLKAVNRTTGETVYFQIQDQKVLSLEEFLADKPTLEGAYGGYGRLPQDLAELRSDYNYTEGYLDSIDEHGLVAWSIKRVIPGIVPVPDDQLPVTLPEVESYEPTDTGESPLASIADWVNVDCPACGGPAKRETDTMPNWAGSNWYYLRYMDAHNDDAFVGEKALDYWKNVDMYLGGMEHTTLHLLYSRFCHQFLYDQKLVITPEPYQARRGQGIVLAADGRKMSKSLGNVINPSDIVAKYGADSMRLYVEFMAPFDETTPWSDERLGGVNRFVHRSWALVQQLLSNNSANDAEGPDGTFVTEVDRLVHKTLKKVHDDLGGMRFNTAIAALMELLNDFNSPKINTRLLEPRHAALSRRTAETFTLMLAPLAPFLAEELWHELGNDDSVHVQPWPQYDPALIKDDVVELAVQVNGKLRGTILAAVDASESEIVETAKANPNVAKHLEGSIVKTIVVPRRLVNFVVK